MAGWTAMHGCHAECIFSNLGGLRSAVHSLATPVALSRCTFDANLAGASSSSVAVVSVGSSDAPVLLEQTVFGESSSLNLRTEGGALVYCDDPTLQCAPRYHATSYACVPLWGSCCEAPRARACGLCLPSQLWRCECTDPLLLAN